VLVGKLAAGDGAAGIDADDSRAALLRVLEILQRAGAEGAVAGAPAPHEDQPGVGVIGRLAPRCLVVGLGAVRHVNGKDLGLGGQIGPEIGAAAEHVQEALRGDAAMQHRRAAGARGVEDRSVAVLGADAKHLARDVVECLVPGDALEAAGASRADTAQRMLQAIRVIRALDLADAAGAGGKWRMGWVPATLVGGDMDDAAVDDVRVDDATATAIVAAGAGDDRLVAARSGARRFVDRSL